MCIPVRVLLVSSVICRDSIWLNISIHQFLPSPPTYLPIPPPQQTLNSEFQNTDTDTEALFC